MARARPSSPPDPLDRLLGEAPAYAGLARPDPALGPLRRRWDMPQVPTVLLQGETGTGKGL